MPAREQLKIVTVAEIKDIFLSCPLQHNCAAPNPNPITICQNLQKSSISEPKKVRPYAIANNEFHLLLFASI